MRAAVVYTPRICTRREGVPVPALSSRLRAQLIGCWCGAGPSHVCLQADGGLQRPDFGVRANQLAPGVAARQEHQGVLNL